MSKTISHWTALAALASALTLHAADARFDLTGPKVEVKVTRGSSVLPIAQVPNLQPGDKIWVHPDFPATQSVHLLVIVSFLRGATNPPPDDWFTKIESWDKKVKSEGVYVTVPQEAQQALIFIAPETGGDFSTLKSAVRGRPGIFVRASSDLAEASFEQSRIEHYLDAMRTIDGNDPKAIAEHSEKLASTLNLKPNKDCFKQPVDQQVNCLRQTGNQTLLDDGHGQTIAATLSNGPSSDFINAASGTQLAGAGQYSAYVGAVVDLVRLMSGLHTAQYQYIPSIAFPQDGALNLRLNTPPSFHNPKSVIVVGLPAIQTATAPPLRPRDPNQLSCLLQPRMVLRLEGAPLVYATSFAHDLVLHLNRSDAPADLPMKPDAFEGGLLVVNEPQRKPLHDISIKNSAAPPAPAEPAAKSTDLTVTGVVRGYWGFDTFEGPTVTVQQTPGHGWQLVGDTQLFAGRENHLAMKGEGTGCIQSIALQPAKGRGKDVTIAFKPAGPPSEGMPAPKDTLDLSVPLQKLNPGGYQLRIAQYGGKSADTLPITAYTSAVRLDNFQIHTGDRRALLEGAALNDVLSVELDGQTFKPTGPSTGDSVEVIGEKPVAPTGDESAKAHLRDGRTLDVDVTVVSARPALSLLSMRSSVQPGNGSLPITLTGKDQIPVQGTLTFVVQTEKEFPRSQQLEVATTDGALHTRLSLENSQLILQDAHTAIATLAPLKVFGPSAFGTLQVRPITEGNVAGDWIPLGKLVRIPTITAVTCTKPVRTSSKKSGAPSTHPAPETVPTTEAAPASETASPATSTAEAAPSTAETPHPSNSCTLTGTEIFLIQQIGSTAEGSAPQTIPTGFADTSLQVPAPGADATLSITLRDDPTAPATLTVPANSTIPESKPMK